MKHLSVLAGLCLLAACALTPPARSSRPDEKAATATQATSATRPEDEVALRGVIAEFTRLFNAGDAKGVAALFTTSARVVTSSGQAIDGREMIEKSFAASFQANPGQTIEVKTESVRFLGSDAAIEEGVASVKTSKGPDEPAGPTETTRYSVAYVKREGKWFQDSIRDYPLPEPAEETSAHEHLKDLEWLVGEWVDESDEADVHTTCRWAENQAFLLRSFQVKIRGKDAMTGSQRIGWDPRLKQIRSWVFDSEGGFSDGLWSRDGDRWVIKTTGVLKDGRTASATNMVSRVGRDTIKWASVDRTYGDEVLADAEEITLVRVPPRPRSSRPRTNPAQPGSTPQ
jgi:uncharacterized protein (TIGR02246 family)